MKYRNDRDAQRYRAEQLSEDLRAAEEKIAEHEQKDVQDERRLAELEAEVARLKEAAGEDKKGEAPADAASLRTASSPDGSRSRLVDAVVMFLFGFFVMVFIAAFGAFGFLGASGFAGVACLVVGMIALAFLETGSSETGLYFIPCIMGVVIGYCVSAAAADSTVISRQGGIPERSVTELPTHADEIIALRDAVLGRTYGMKEERCGTPQNRRTCTAHVRGIVQEGTVASPDKVGTTPGAGSKVYAWLSVDDKERPPMGTRLKRVRLLESDDYSMHDEAIANARNAPPVEPAVAKDTKLYEIYDGRVDRKWFKGTVERAFATCVGIWFLCVLVLAVKGKARVSFKF